MALKIFVRRPQNGSWRTFRSSTPPWGLGAVLARARPIPLLLIPLDKNSPRKVGSFCLAHDKETCLHPLLEEIRRWRKLLAVDYERHKLPDLSPSHE